jgi:hypothetical protein
MTFGHRGHVVVKSRDQKKCIQGGSGVAGNGRKLWRNPIIKIIDMDNRNLRFSLGVRAKE